MLVLSSTIARNWYVSVSKAKMSSSRSAGVGNRASLVGKGFALPIFGIGNCAAPALHCAALRCARLSAVQRSLTVRAARTTVNANSAR